MLKTIPKKTVTDVEEAFSSIIQCVSDELVNAHHEINNALQVRVAKDPTYLLIRRNSSASWHKFTKKALALLVQRSSRYGNTGELSYADASELVEKLIRIAPVAMNVSRRMARTSCRHCGAIERTDSPT